MNPGRLLIVSGVVLVAAGLLITLGGRLPFRIGKLPGDILVEGRRGTFYFPVVTCLLISLILTLAGWLLNRR